jgi:predicted RNA-binding protein with PUA-like domain
MADPRYWLIKSEPDVYPYAQLEADRHTEWNGIRNFEARNNLRAMKPGDLCLYYHTGDEKAVVGIARVLTEAKADSTAPGEDWAAVDVAPVKALARPVTLAQVKAHKSLKAFPLVTRSRLSVAPVTPEQFALVLRLSGTPPP